MEGDEDCKATAGGIDVRLKVVTAFCRELGDVSELKHGDRVAAVFDENQLKYPGTVFFRDRCRNHNRFEEFEVRFDDGDMRSFCMDDRDYVRRMVERLDEQDDFPNNEHYDLDTMSSIVSPSKELAGKIRCLSIVPSKPRLDIRALFCCDHVYYPQTLFCDRKRGSALISLDFDGCLRHPHITRIRITGCHLEQLGVSVKAWPTRLCDFTNQYITSMNRLKFRVVVGEPPQQISATTGEGGEGESKDGKDDGQTVLELEVQNDSDGSSSIMSSGVRKLLISLCVRDNSVKVTSIELFHDKKQDDGTSTENLENGITIDNPALSCTHKNDNGLCRALRQDDQNFDVLLLCKQSNVVQWKRTAHRCVLMHCGYFKQHLSFQENCSRFYQQQDSISPETKGVCELSVPGSIFDETSIDVLLDYLYNLQIRPFQTLSACTKGMQMAHYIHEPALMSLLSYMCREFIGFEPILGFLESELKCVPAEYIQFVLSVLVLSGSLDYSGMRDVVDHFKRVGYNKNNADFLKDYLTTCMLYENEFTLDRFVARKRK